MSSLLSSTGNLLQNTVDQGAKGVSAVGNAGAQGLSDVGRGVNKTLNPSEKEEKEKNSGEIPIEPAASATKNVSNNVPIDSDTTSVPSSEPPKSGGGVGGFFQSAGNAFTSGATTVLNPAVEASKAGGAFLQDVSTTGFNIGKNVAKTGVDVTKNVAYGTVDLAGTAIGGVITAAVDTTGKAFEPVASGLKAVHGLEGLGEGLEKVNGLPILAVKEVGNWTIKAMNMSGKTPTFFDTDGDGVVSMQDTIKGLIILGLDDKYANYAAYALHGIFSYPTSSSWVPSTDKNLPIHIDKMSNTRWGKNWGTFERMDWCQDIDVQTFFENTENDDASTFEKWKETFTKGRQYFGVLLLIFEWGTTWPFVFPPNVPVEQLPFKDEIGQVVRKLILPTIFANYQRAQGQEGSKPPAKPPSEDAPSDHKDA